MDSKVNRLRAAVGAGALLILALAACGGGGATPTLTSSSGANPTSIIAAAPTASPTLPPTEIIITRPACVPGTLWPIVLERHTVVGVSLLCNVAIGDVVTITSDNPADTFTQTTSKYVGNPFFWSVAGPIGTYTITDTNNGAQVVITPTTVTAD